MNFTYLFWFVWAVIITLIWLPFTAYLVAYFSTVGVHSARLVMFKRSRDALFSTMKENDRDGDSKGEGKAGAA